MSAAAQNFGGSNLNKANKQTRKVLDMVAITTYLMLER
jgi:hypothetical protein